MNTSISILGTGWLGLPLAIRLQELGYLVKGSTTSEEKVPDLKIKNIKPYLLELTESGVEGNISEFLKNSTILIINIPPGLRKNPESNFVAKIQKIFPFIEISSVKKVLFISSTSVFADHENFPMITSKTSPDATNNSGKQLLEVEELLQSNSHFKTTILRFGGLYDERRHPASMLSKRSDIKNPLAPVNLIHRIDCLGIIQKIIEGNYWNQKFNAASPQHPSKYDYYSKVCREMGLSVPDYDHTVPSEGKIIDASELMSRLSYSFQTAL